jgi:NAD(P)-dependent dehydrogenase (short-subunit alcohol dehydrogenase family)
MQDSSSGVPKILITGGTSGLGHQLAMLFLRRGYYVVITGRRELSFPEKQNNFSFYRVDFSDMKTTSEVFRKIAGSHQFDIVINNAGILSPPQRTLSKDGMEYTFQVNFLAHLLVNEIIIKNKLDTKPLIIATITSPVYKLSKVNISKSQNYSALGAYSDSKFYSAIMCSHLADVYKGRNFVFFSFDPGVFGSGIYRMQSRFFAILYKIASPFMRSPSKVASVLGDILLQKEVTGNVIYNVRKRVKSIPATDQSSTEIFWKECHEMINPFLH